MQAAIFGLLTQCQDGYDSLLSSFYIAYVLVLHGRTLSTMARFLENIPPPDQLKY